MKIRQVVYWGIFLLLMFLMFLKNSAFAHARGHGVPLRVWKNQVGEVVVRANFLKYENDEVWLVDEYTVVQQYKLSDFSASDQDYIKEIYGQIQALNTPLKSEAKHFSKEFRYTLLGLGLLFILVSFLIFRQKPKVYSAFLAAFGAIVITTACNKDDDNNTPDTASFTLTSEAIVNGQLLDAYKCEDKGADGTENSIPLAWSNVPAEAASLAVIMHHYPFASDTTNVNSYLLLWGIDPGVTEIPYGTADDGPWYMGANKDGTAISYTSPCSPSSATHAYTITVYALDQLPSSLPAESSLAVDYATLKAAISSVTVVGEAVLDFEDITP